MYGQPSASSGGGSSRSRSRRRHYPPAQAKGAPHRFDSQMNQQNLNLKRSKKRSQTWKESKEQLEKVGCAVEQARLKIVGVGESVTSWNVSQDALLMLKVDSWSSLGFSMQEVPNLHRLFVTEGKINAFIHCFIAVRRITSLYDLEGAICENEGVEKFEELELGPLLRHPLVLHYFSVNSDVTEVFKITSEEIFCFLWKFVRSKKYKYKDIKAEEFLDFIAKKKSVENKEKLGIRVQSLGMHISAIRKAGFSESSTIKKSAKALKSESDKKCRKHPHRMHISAIRKAGFSESSTIKKSAKALKSESDKKCRKHPHRMHISAIRKAGFSESSTIKKSAKALKSESDKKCRKHLHRMHISAIRKAGFSESSTIKKSAKALKSESDKKCRKHLHRMHISAIRKAGFSESSTIKKSAKALKSESDKKCRKHLHRMHISAIRKAGFSESSTIKKSAKALKSESDKKCRKHSPLLSLKKQLAEPSNSMSQSIESFLSEKTDLCGGHKRFVTSCSDDENNDDCTSDDERLGNSTGDQNNLLSETVRSSDQVSGCPCPFQIEEIAQVRLNGEICGQPFHAGGNPSHNERTGLSKKKGKSGNLGCTVSAHSESFKGKNKTENLGCTMSTPSLKIYEVDTDIDYHAVEYYNEPEEDSNVNEPDLVIANNSKRTCLSKKEINSVRPFITTWKEAFQEHTVLKDNILYTTEESDCHAIYMELSRLLFNGTPDSHLANFLHMNTNIAESGSTEEQTQFFILNSQKVPKLPDEESVWCLSPVEPSLRKNDDSPQASFSSTATDEKGYLKPVRKVGNNSNWPPVDWKSAPGCSYAQANDNVVKTLETSAQHGGSPQKKEDNYEGTVMQTDNVVSISTSDDWTIEDDSASAAMAFVLSDNYNLEDHSNQACNQIDSGMEVEFDPRDLDTRPDGSQFASSNFHKRDQLRTGTPDATQAACTGRLGELIAFKYITGKAGETIVKWVNEDSETGLPYDIAVGKENSKEYIEVKATKSQTKDWFNISTRQWQFAVDKGESYSIMHVVLLGNNVARVSVFKNPVKLCQLGKLQLVAMTPTPQKGFSIVF